MKCILIGLLVSFAGAYKKSGSRGSIVWIGIEGGFPGQFGGSFPIDNDHIEVIQDIGLSPVSSFPDGVGSVGPRDIEVLRPSERLLSQPPLNAGNIGPNVDGNIPSNENRGRPSPVGVEDFPRSLGGWIMSGHGKRPVGSVISSGGREWLRGGQFIDNAWLVNNNPAAGRVSPISDGLSIPDTLIPETFAGRASPSRIMPNIRSNLSSGWLKSVGGMMPGSSHGSGWPSSVGEMMPGSAPFRGWPSSGGDMMPGSSHASRWPSSGGGMMPGSVSNSGWPTSGGGVIPGGVPEREVTSFIPEGIPGGRWQNAGFAPYSTGDRHVLGRRGHWPSARRGKNKSNY